MVAADNAGSFHPLPSSQFPCSLPQQGSGAGCGHAEEQGTPHLQCSAGLVWSNWRIISFHSVRIKRILFTNCLKLYTHFPVQRLRVKNEQSDAFLQTEGKISSSTLFTAPMPWKRRRCDKYRFNTTQSVSFLTGSRSDLRVGYCEIRGYNDPSNNVLKTAEYLSLNKWVKHTHCV